MHELTLIRQSGGNYINCCQGAEVIGKQHEHIRCDIRDYAKVLWKITQSNFGVSDFFLESSYLNSTGRTLSCDLLSKMGCEMVANKLICEKGMLFTAAYVRIIVRGLKDFGATPEQIMEFLKETYEPLGFTVAIGEPDEAAMHWHSAREIAERCGIYSLYNKPHSQAVSCILNENLFIREEHKRIITENHGTFTSVRVRYDDFALCEVMKWLVENELPEEIYGFDRTYYVKYQI